MNLDSIVPEVFIRFPLLFGLYRGKRIAGFSLLGMVLLLAPPLFSPVQAALSGVEVHKDISYVKDDDPCHRLDLYLPEGKEGVPVLLFIHGGGWRRGDKQGSLNVYIKLGEALAQEGIATVVANYRLVPGVKYRSQAQDVAAALKWTRDKIAGFGGDPSRIYIGGHSAGAHLALLSVADPDYGADPVDGIIFWSGIADINIAMDTSPIFTKIGMYTPAFGKDPEKWYKASPINFLSRMDVPLLIMYGDGNFPQILQQSKLLLKKSRDLGLPVTERIITGKSHFSEVFSFPDRYSEARKAIVGFIGPNR